MVSIVTFLTFLQIKHKVSSSLPETLWLEAADYISHLDTQIESFVADIRVSQGVIGIMWVVWVGTLVATKPVMKTHIPPFSSTHHFTLVSSFQYEPQHLHCFAQSSWHTITPTVSYTHQHTLNFKVSLISFPRQKCFKHEPILSSPSIICLSYFSYSLIIYPAFLSPLSILPGPPRDSLLLGNLPSTVKNDASSAHRQWVEKYGGALRFFNPFGVCISTILNDPDIHWLRFWQHFGHIARADSDHWSSSTESYLA